MLTHVNLTDAMIQQKHGRRRISTTASATPMSAVPRKSVSYYDFFIAYATPDRRQAQDLCWCLQDHSCKVFLDVKDLSPGALWPLVLREALEASRAIVVL